MSEDRRLLRALQRGEIAAWRRIYLKYKDDLLAATDVKKGADGDIQLNVEFMCPKTGPADIYEAGAPKTAKITPSPEP